MVGGGIAGAEAAIVAAQRGHRVTLFEREANWAASSTLRPAPPHKSELLNTLTYRVRMMEKLGVAVRMGTKVTADMVREGKPDAVILATGALPQRPPIPGINRPDVIQAKDVLTGRGIPRAQGRGPGRRHGRLGERPSTWPTAAAK